MLMGKEQMKMALEMFVDKELNKGSAIQKFVVFGTTYLLLNRMDDVWERLQSNPLTGMLFQDGEVDGSELIGALREAMKKTGSINIGGIIFSAPDVDALERYINEAVATY